jgi:hypothetical protein
MIWDYHAFGNSKSEAFLHSLLYPLEYDIAIAMQNDAMVIEDIQGEGLILAKIRILIGFLEYYQTRITVSQAIAWKDKYLGLFYRVVDEEKKKPRMYAVTEGYKVGDRKYYTGRYKVIKHLFCDLEAMASPDEV